MKVWWAVQDVVFVLVAVAIIAGVIFSVPYIKKNEDRWRFQAKTNKQEELKRKIDTQDMSRDLTKMRKDFDALKEKYDAFVKQQNSTHLEIDIDLRNLGNDVKSLMPIEPKEKKEEPEKKPEPVRSHPYGNWRP